jgi:hypothetical protein
MCTENIISNEGMSKTFKEFLSSKIKIITQQYFFNGEIVHKKDITNAKTE